MQNKRINVDIVHACLHSSGAGRSHPTTLSNSAHMTVHVILAEQVAGAGKRLESKDRGIEQARAYIGAAMVAVKFENGEIYSHLYAVKSINIKYVFSVAEVLVMLILHLNVVAKRETVKHRERARAIPN